MYSFSWVKEFATAQHCPALAELYMLNPLAVIITAYRALILPDAVFPMTAGISGGIFIAVVFVMTAYGLFQKLQRNFSDMF